MWKKYFAAAFIIISAFVGQASAVSVGEMQAENVTIDETQLETIHGYDKRSLRAELTIDRLGRPVKYERSDGFEIRVAYDPHGGRAFSFVGTTVGLSDGVRTLVGAASGHGLDRTTITKIKREFGSKSDYTPTGGCSSFVVCVGLLDDVMAFLSALSNAIQVGAAVGSTGFVIAAILEGAALAEVATMAGLGAVFGTGVVLAAASGAVIGYGIYNTAGDLVWTKFF